MTSGPPRPPVTVLGHGTSRHTQTSSRLVFIHADTGETRIFEMSDRRNDALALYQFIYWLRDQQLP
jgi:hypothetical protein